MYEVGIHSRAIEIRGETVGITPRQNVREGRKWNDASQLELDTVDEVGHNFARIKLDTWMGQAQRLFQVSEVGSHFAVRDHGTGTMFSPSVPDGSEVSK